MDELICSVLVALSDADLHCVRAFPALTLPRLKSPMVAVGADSALCRQSAISRYLGQDTAGNERYGMQLDATILMEVYAPAKDGGALCDAAVSDIVSVFLQGIDGICSGNLTIHGTSFDQTSNCYRCKVCVPVSKRLYADSDEGTFNTFYLKGVIQ